MGDVCRPDHPWCLVFPSAPGAPAYRHPSQIYEAILDILTLPILLIVYRLKPKDGVVAWTWFTCYGITRTIAEMWRQTDFSWMGLTGGQLYALDDRGRSNRNSLLCDPARAPHASPAGQAGAWMTLGVEARYRALRAEIDSELHKEGRDPAGVTLVGVGKRQPPEIVAQAIQAGLTDLGESYLQEARRKFDRLPPVRKHFIGHVQTNKAKADCRGVRRRPKRRSAEAGFALGRAARERGRATGAAAAEHHALRSLWLPSR